MTEQSRQPPLIVVAGQVPPPTGGQNVMVQRILNELSAEDAWRTVHLPFYFTPSFQSVRRFRFEKGIELFAVWVRFLRLVIRHGCPDILVYPSGGPQPVPVVRDILLLPLFCSLSRKVVVQFHAAGVADRLAARHGLLEKTLVWVHRKVAGAIVMTDFNRCDPAALGIQQIEVIPHRLPDENPECHLPDYSAFLKIPASCKNVGDQGQEINPNSEVGAAHSSFNILYAGHLYDLKGTPQLIEAFASISAEFPLTKLVLMGEFLPPYSETACRTRCCELGIEGRVEITGLLKEEQKAVRFRAAHLFVFPSVAPYESFGLVIAEAMMWGLPIVATDWRGNREVAGPEAIYFQAADSRTLSGLGESLLTVLSNLSGLRGLASSSRRRYERHYRLKDCENDYCNAVGQWLCRNCILTARA